MVNSKHLLVNVFGTPKYPSDFWRSLPPYALRARQPTGCLHAS